MESTPVQPRSGLGRPIDLSYPSNVAALALSGLALAWGLGRRNGPSRALASAGWVFTTWALARELDNDEPGSAVLAAAGMVPLAALRPADALAGGILTGSLMTVARALAGTSGQALTRADRLVVRASAVGMAAGVLIGHGGSARDRYATLAALAALAAREPGAPRTPADNGAPIDPGRARQARRLAVAVGTAAAVLAPRAALGVAATALAIAVFPRTARR